MIKIAGVVVEATGAVNVQVASVNQHTTEGFLALPVQLLGTEYVAITYIYEGQSRFSQVYLTLYLFYIFNYLLLFFCQLLPKVVYMYMNIL